ncbi:hypothetical protein M513_13186 [Trichuris suis]|uniref:Uncharacterized protein n=1 Tax=Trichuris suis TaxID=68888 RepID=A0A085LLV2_9BILA|nr:hypothetical protein M513_13186 [Trichuris suis]
MACLRSVSCGQNRLVGFVYAINFSLLLVAAWKVTLFHYAIRKLSCFVARSNSALLQSPTLRIGIVNVYCELVSVKLHGKNLEPRDRKSICTTVMQVYAVEFFNCNVERLLIEKCMPLSTFRRLVRLVSGRVKDESVLFRKCALPLLTALVENNPFLVKLSIESVSLQTDNVKADLERLRLLSESMDCTFVVHPLLAVVSVLPAAETFVMPSS